MGPPCPGSHIIGSYCLLEQLSAGGMGVVYRARHVETGEEVALKSLSVPDAARLSSLRREIHALCRLRHPGIVRIVAKGVQEGLPWYAMELLEGLTLRKRIDAWWEPARAMHRPPAAAGRLAEAIAMVRRLCAPLAFLHGEGIVHDDLTPRNILLRPGDLPVLVDFGLSVAFSGARGGEPLHAGGVIAGSFGYMAPERIDGEVGDARADLYSLGCILYELITGRPVFAGHEALLLKQHLADAPAPPSQWVEGVPAQLDELVLRLLAKRPRERLGYAEDVASLLGAMEVGGATTTGGGTGGRLYLYRPEFAGRADLLEILERSLDRAKHGAGQCVLIGGESGAGKTRLAMEVATAANRRAFRVITGECLPIEGGSLQQTRVRGAPLHPLAPLLQALADQCRTAGAGAAAALLGPNARVLALHSRPIADLRELDSFPVPQPLPAEEARLRLFSALRHAVAAFSSVQPLLLVLDDLQWADDLTLAALAFLGRELPRRARALILGTYRIEEVEPLRELLGGPGIETLRLERLNEGMVSTIVGDMLALPAPPAAFVRFLAEQSAGNPYFIAEYLRTAIREGLLDRSQQGQWQVTERGRALEELRHVLPLPGSLRDLLERRLVRLDGRARGLVELAAVLGREFEAGMLAPGEPEVPQHMEAVGELCARGLLTDAGPGRLRFTHDRLREIAYEGIPPGRRRALHLEATRRLNARGAASDPLLYGVLAHHFLMGSAHREAFEYLGKAGEHALSRGANADAAHDFAQALALAEEHGAAGGWPDRQQYAECERLLGESYWAMGDLSRTLQQMQRALARAGFRVPGSAAGWAALWLRQAARQALHLAVGGGRAVMTRARARSLLMTVAQAAGRLAECFFFNRRRLPMMATALLCVNCAERAGRREEAPYSQLGLTVGILGVSSLSRLYFRRAREVAQGRTRPLCVVLWLEALLHLTRGRWSAAQQAAHEASGLLREVGDAGLLLDVQTFRMLADYYRGRFEATLPLIEETSALARYRTNVWREATGAYGVARSLIALGRLDEAVDLLLRALRLLERQEDRMSRILCHGLLATAWLYRGDREQARRLADATVALAREETPTSITEGRAYEGAAQVYLTLWERALHGGDGAGALQRDAACACALLQKFARRFPPGRPAAFRCWGLYQRLAGHPRRARMVWWRGLRVARALEMPYDEALLHFELGRGSAPGTPDREVHLRQALAGFSRMGCRHHLREVEALLQGNALPLVEAEERQVHEGDSPGCRPA